MRPRDRYGRPLAPGSRDELRRVEPPAVLEDAIRLGVELFDGCRFFEAHEIFEHVWKSDDENADFWKAVTQVCAALCHVQRGNVGGARSVLARAIDALDGERRAVRGIDGTELAARARTVSERLSSDSSEPCEFPEFPFDS